MNDRVENDGIARQRERFLERAAPLDVTYREVRFARNLGYRAQVVGDGHDPDRRGLTCRERSREPDGDDRRAFRQIGASPDGISKLRNTSARSFSVRDATLYRWVDG